MDDKRSGSNAAPLTRAKLGGPLQRQELLELKGPRSRSEAHITLLEGK